MLSIVLFDVEGGTSVYEICFPIGSKYVLLEQMMPEPALSAIWDPSVFQIISYWFKLYVKATLSQFAVPF